MVDRYERILGGLFGIACGDALGGTLEFMSKYEIERKYGYLKDIIGGGCWDLAPGEVTDDTMMTIAVAEGILDNPGNPIEDIGKHFIEWYDSKPKDIGNIIRIALGEYKRSNDWMKTAYYAHQATGGMSAGNGSLMRCLPVALYYNDVEKMLEITASQSVLLLTPTQFAGTSKKEEHLESLSTIIEKLNKRFGTDFSPADQLSVEQIKEDFAVDADMINKAKTNSIDDFRFAFEKAFMGKVVERMGQNQKFFVKILDDPQFANALMELMLSEVYDRLKNTAV